jgi:hypothetical protein
MITCVSCVLLLTKLSIYACIFSPMKHVLFIDSVCDGKSGAAYGPARGSTQDHF